MDAPQANFQADGRAFESRRPLRFQMRYLEQRYRIFLCRWESRWELTTSYALLSKAADTAAIACRRLASKLWA